ncbi:MAG: SGNH/GDSL hydrolase family protein, partial [Candidatus Alcyoniella australis]|nr:SGNH/GDSL hydrolase family protein [Candidatus Alcyoniella australis]
IVLTAAGCLLLLCALVYGPTLLGMLSADLPGKARQGALADSRLWFALLGLLALLAARLSAPRIDKLDDRKAQRRRSNLVLFLVALLLPLCASELTLRPFSKAHYYRAITQHDSELGWRNKSDVRVQRQRGVVQLNSKGLRNPEIDYAKPAGVQRIMFLGDSVAFGSGLPGERYTFAYVTTQMLKQRGYTSLEYLNAGVEGYSPWQELIYLRREGLRFDPDCVVLCFVLNDLVEKFTLRRFGGEREAVQVPPLYRRITDRLCAASAIFYFGRQLSARLRLGSDVQRGASLLQTESVLKLARGGRSPEFDEAWRITLENVDGIVELCREHKVKLMIALFPYKFQFMDPQGLTQPQQRMLAFAAQRSVPAIDLLGPLQQQAEQNNVTVLDLFWDDVHPSAAGSFFIAITLAEFITTQGLLEPGAPTD